MRGARGGKQGFSALALALALAAAPGAAAQPTAADKEKVLALYDEGKELVARGSIAEGCAKFEEGKRRDPTALNLLLRLADCYERAGRPASAWTQYAEVAALAKSAGDRRAEEATTHASALEPRLVRLTVSVPPASDLPGLEVRRNGVPIVRGQWASATPVDPGQVTIEAAAPGRLRWVTTIVVGAGPGSASVSVPVLALEPRAQAVHSPVTTGVPAAGDARSVPGARQRTLAFVVAGAGLAGVGIGSALGLMALGKRDDSNAGHCDAQSLCDAEGLRLRGDARSAGTASTVAFALGAAALAGGVVLWATAPSRPGVAAAHATAVATVAPGGAAIGVGGRF